LKLFFTDNTIKPIKLIIMSSICLIEYEEKDIDRIKFTVTMITGSTTKFEMRLNSTIKQFKKKLSHLKQPIKCQTIILSNGLELHNTDVLASCTENRSIRSMIVIS